MRAGLRRTGLVRVLLSLFFFGAGLASSVAFAQTDVQSILDSIKNGAQIPAPTGVQNQTTTLTPTVTPTTQTLTPQTASTSRSAPSRLELLYSQRAGRTLTQFGYDQFGTGSPVPATQIGGIQDNYILGSGDQLVITLRGHENATYQAPIDRDGRVVIPNIDPVSAAGRTFGEVRKDLEARIATAMIGTKAFISVATVRQISVVVSGEVNAPGVRTLSGLNSAIDAILLSGGIRKTGSLRSITITRGTQHYTIDLYSIIAKGRAGAIGALTDGDRIYVPPIQATVAIAGYVKRPGIYELASGATAIDVRSLITLAGGVEIAGAKRLSKLEIERDGRGRVTALGTSGTIRSGEVLFVDQDRAVTLGRVLLDGAVNTPGARPLGASATMSQVLRDPDDLGPDAYTLFSVIIHRDRRSNFRTAQAFSVKRVFDGSANPALDNDDHVYIFTRGEVQMLAAAAAMSLSSQPLVTLPSTGDATSSVTPQTGTSLTQQAQTITNPALQSASPASPAQTGGLSPSQMQALAANGNGQSGAGAAALAAAAAAQNQNAQMPASTVNPNDLSNFPDQFAPGRVQTDVTASPPQQAASIQELAARLQISDVELMRFARDYLVWVNGEVRSEGPYLVDTGTNLQDLVQAAGGFQLQADLSSVEVTTTTLSPLTGTSETVRTIYHATGGQFANVILRPLDSVRVRPVYSDRDAGQITITGQVKFPGTFDVTRGEKLSSVLLRAGGLTNEGYPYGAVFTRISAQKAEAQGNQRAASSLENQLATVAADPQVTPTQISYLANLAQSMRNAPVVGRITVTADPVVLATHPELDMLMEPGDKIYVPKRPSTVAVSGEVLNPGAFQYREGLTVDDYMQLAGGENADADSSSIFVLLPDGTAKPSRGSWWRFGSDDRIPPGSTIVIPRDPRPFVLSQFLTTSIDLISKLALTAASVAVIGR